MRHHIVESSEGGGKRFLRNVGICKLYTHNIPETLKMEAADFSETLINDYLCTLHQIPDALKMGTADFFETLVNVYCIHITPQLP
jgi:hypothetical protein